jgi:hypothetical protein
MNNILTKILKSEDHGSYPAELHEAEEQIAELIKDGWTVESSRCIKLEVPENRQAQVNKIPLFDYCFILKKEEVLSGMLNS